MPQAEPATSQLDLDATEVGSVFVSNYPPYSFWSTEELSRVEEALGGEPQRGTEVGLYLHIPFCRRRCKFCYFRVYTDKNGEQVKRYTDALAREVEAYADQPAMADRRLHFIYFGGGTPSYLGVKQLLPLVDRLKGAMPWSAAEEIAFECEPGTLSQPKLEALRDIGVTRLSLGIENFDDAILRENGRAHLSEEIYRVKPWIDELDFPQLNVDLIAGMVGESWQTWKDSVERTIDYDPDSVTLYQMELPFNTVYSKAKLQGEGAAVFADWKTKREWHAYAFDRFAEAGYQISSAYTVLKKGRDCRFVYRDSLWHGADMLGAGVSSFSHLGGLHFQNVDGFDEYIARIESGELAAKRAFLTTEEERLTREVVLQLKTGRLCRTYFQDKFGEDIHEVFATPLGRLQERGLITVAEGEVWLEPGALLRVDQLLPEFYAERYRGSRYT